VENFFSLSKSDFVVLEDGKTSTAGYKFKERKGNKLLEGSVGYDKTSNE
jgi:hypothetical protein